jgi:predicted methyltransferase
MSKLNTYLVAFSLLLAILQPACAGDESRITAALASPARSDADRERDTRDKPQAVLAFAGFGEGMTIADVFGGGGYLKRDPVSRGR